MWSASRRVAATRISLGVGRPAIVQSRVRCAVASATVSPPLGGGAGGLFRVRAGGGGQKAPGPPPTKVGQGPQRSRTVNGTVVGWPVVWRATTKVVEATPLSEAG